MKTNTKKPVDSKCVTVRIVWRHGHHGQSESAQNFKVTLQTAAEMAKNILTDADELSVDGLKTTLQNDHAISEAIEQAGTRVTFRFQIKLPRIGGAR